MSTEIEAVKLLLHAPSTKLTRSANGKAFFCKKRDGNALT